MRKLFLSISLSLYLTAWIYRFFFFIETTEETSNGSQGAGWSWKTFKGCWRKIGWVPPLLLNKIRDGSQNPMSTRAKHRTWKYFTCVKWTSWKTLESSRHSSKIQVNCMHCFLKNIVETKENTSVDNSWLGGWKILAIVFLFKCAVFIFF